MPIPQEICVLFPCHTLEDFPTHLRDEAAEGVLAAWTAPWHPSILAAVGEVPTWHRADTPPVELEQRLLLIPDAATSRLPSDLVQRVGDAVDCEQISVTSRQATTKQILAYLNQNGDERSNHSEFDHKAAPSPQVEIEDFFALGYATLQIQIMTRKLRYSSNLDLVTFSEHVVAAARAWQNQAQAVASERLQAAFDLLGEERDHYFSGDPQLIDLVLVAPSTVGGGLLSTLAGDSPLNLLLSAETAELIAAEQPLIVERIKQRLAQGTLCIAGGCPNDQDRLDLLGAAQIGDWLNSAIERTATALGSAPRVFGRLGGGIPGDLPPWLNGAAMVGAITNDFYSGIGSQGEAKMLWQSGGAEIEALTAKPLDTNQPHSFLGIGPRLGEAADSGQVAAVMLVRWPGTDSDWLQLIRRTTRFTPALGHLWKLDDFFTSGERPYHSCTLPAVQGDGHWLEQQVTAGEQNPLSVAAEKQQLAIRREATQTCLALANLLSPAMHSEQGSSDNETTCQLTAASRLLATALGFEACRTPHANPSDSHQLTAASAVVLNPFSGAARAQLTLVGPPPLEKTPGLYGANKQAANCDVTLDVPGNGFASLTAGPSGSSGSDATKKGFLGFFSKSKSLVVGQSLTNEFLDVAIHPQTGAVAAVHAGAQRGNRFSWQLAYYDQAGPDDGYSKMVCQRIKTVESNLARGAIEVSGQLVVSKQPVADYKITYRLERGSRWLDIDIELDGDQATLAGLSDSPWQNYFAGRAAWASAALSMRPLVRDKRHRTKGRRLEAPLGVVIDEGDRKLQVCSHGLPAHRRIGSERLDSLLITRGEQTKRFQLAYGFDVKAPLRAVRQKMLPPLVVPLDRLTAEAARGWLFDIDSRQVIAIDWDGDDSKRLRITLVETTGQPVKTRLQLFQDIVTCRRLHDDLELKVDNGAAIIPLAGHEVVRLELTIT